MSTYLPISLKRMAGSKESDKEFGIKHLDPFSLSRISGQCRDGVFAPTKQKPLWADPQGRSRMKGNLSRQFKMVFLRKLNTTKRNRSMAAIGEIAVAPLRLISRCRHYLRGGRGSIPAMVLKALTTSLSRGSSATSFCWSSAMSGVG